MTEAQIKAAENLGWSVWEYDDEWLIQNHSPAGEDLPLEIEKDKDIIEWLKWNAETFDPDDNVELWINLRGQNGVPRTARELVDDADAIKKMYLELAEAVANAKED